MRDFIILVLILKCLMFSFFRETKSLKKYIKIGVANEKSVVRFEKKLFEALTFYDSFHIY